MNKPDIKLRRDFTSKLQDLMFIDQLGSFNENNNSQLQIRSLI